MADYTDNNNTNQSTNLNQTPKRRSRFSRPLIVTAIAIVLIGAAIWGIAATRSMFGSDVEDHKTAAAQSSVLKNIAQSQNLSAQQLKTLQQIMDEVDRALQDKEGNTDGKKISERKSKANKEIQRRLDILQELKKNLESSKDVSAANRKDLIKQIDDQIDGLNKLLEKTKSAPDIKTLSKYMNEVHTEYRVYSFMRPKVALVIATDRLQNAINKLAETADKLQATIENAQAQGKNVNDQVKKLQQMQNNVADAQKIHDSVVKAVLAATSEDWNQDHKVLSEQRDNLKEAQAKLNDASGTGNDTSDDMGHVNYKADPNIVFILTDDQSLDLMKFMPNTTKLIAKEGASFSNYFDNISLCCAARASILRGQYAHNSKVEDNSMPTGGWQRYNQLKEQNNDLSVWMKKAGYETSLMGKYLNNYPDGKDRGYAQYNVKHTYIPTGWTDWFVPVEGRPYSEYNYTVNNNGRLFKRDKEKNDYLVDVISNRAAKFIKDRKDSKKPYFMYLATYAPHSPYTPAPRYINTEKGRKYPPNKAFNETDVTDKPTFIAQKSQLTEAQINKINKIYQKRAEAARGVDDLVKNVYDSLKSTDQLDNTYIVFTSDNGYHMGEHRLDVGKYTPYETDIHLPLLVRGPGVRARTKIDNIVGNIDLAPTFATLGGAEIPDFVDGQSLTPYLLKKGHQHSKRKYYLLERQPSVFMGTPSSEQTSSTPPDETADPSVTSTGDQTPPEAFQGVRSDDGFVYVKYGNGQQEFYDLHNDAFELSNLLPPRPDKPELSKRQSEALAGLKKALRQLRKCQGKKCVTAGNRRPRQPSS